MLHGSWQQRGDTIKKNLRCLLIPLGNTEFCVLNRFPDQSSMMVYSTRWKLSCNRQQLRSALLQSWEQFSQGHARVTFKDSRTPRGLFVVAWPCPCWRKAELWHGAGIVPLTVPPLFTWPGLKSSHKAFPAQTVWRAAAAKLHVLPPFLLHLQKV